MITFPCAKINLGLNIVSKRKDGYHNLETVFYPIPLTDALEIKLMGDEFPSDVPCDLKITGNAVDCDEQNNLVVKAYNLLAADFRIPASFCLFWGFYLHGDLILVYLCEDEACCE